MGTLVNGIKEIFATSQSTATHLPVCASDGTPQGRISVGDLASVLGAVVKKTSAGSNWDEITTSGVYYVSNGSSATGSPSGAYQWGTLVVMSSVGGSGIMGVVQMYFENDSAGGRVWQRNRWQTINGFRPWVELTTNMPTFYKNYSDLSSLASALGASRNGTGGAIDANTLTTTGTFVCNQQSTNTAKNGAWGIIDMQVLSTASAATVYIQKFYTLTAPLKMYYRTFHNDIWEEWAEI